MIDFIGENWCSEKIPGLSCKKGFATVANTRGLLVPEILDLTGSLLDNSPNRSSVSFKN
jgi:hypothetical protein